MTSAVLPRISPSGGWADLQRQLVDEEARIAKVASETEVYGNIRYFEGKGEVLTQLDEAKKSLDGWVRFGESLFQAHRAGNKIEISRLLDRVASWACVTGKRLMSKGHVDRYLCGDLATTIFRNIR
jgi:hypothetical protein